MARIHSSAIVDPSAELDADVEVGAYSVIGAGVRVGAGTRIGPHVVVEGPHHASVATTGSSSSRRSAPTRRTRSTAANQPRLEIGDGNTIREFVTINRGTAQDRTVTRVGSDDWIMAYVHIAHDCIVGDHVSSPTAPIWPATSTSATGRSSAEHTRCTSSARSART